MAKNTKKTAAAKKSAKKGAEKTGTKKGSKAERTTKKCSLCKLDRPLTEFYRPKKDCRCKECNKVYARQRRQTLQAMEDALAKNKAAPIGKKTVTAEKKPATKKAAKKAA